MSYDKNNIFAKILRGEIPCKKVYENEYVLSFHDINPQKKIHVLVIPKNEYLIKFDDLVAPVYDKIEFNYSQIQSLTKTRDTLLPKLMSGQVRVNKTKQTVDA